MEINISESKYDLKRKKFSINNLKLFESYQLIENETRINLDSYLKIGDHIEGICLV